MSPKTKPAAVALPEPPKPTASGFESIVLVLQGGGALGAYQAGVYEALAEHGIAPTWVSGISIGAINSAIIAGNEPAKRVEKLRTFWELVSAGTVSWTWLDAISQSATRGYINQFAASDALVQGVKGFFTPRFPPPPFQPAGMPGAISWYDTTPLRGTLETLVDFDLINSKAVRFSVGAVNVRTGNFAYFDNAKDTIRPEHVMASGALPPAFPAVKVDGEDYWDGGLVSNTPLEWALSAHSDIDTLVFQVDLWSAKGIVPRDLGDVAERMKDIQYSSRTRAATDQFRKQQRLHAVFQTLLAKLPPDLAASPEAQLLARSSGTAAFNIVELIYRSPDYEADSKDYEFSRRTMEDHWRAGHRDATKTLSHPEVLRVPDKAAAVNVFDFLRP